MPELMINADDIAAALARNVSDFTAGTEVEQVGRIAEVGDGIARVTGLPGATVNELLEFENGTVGLALNLDEESIGAVVLGTMEGLDEGQVVRSTGRILSVPVGDALLGRVVNPLGEPIDGKGPLGATRCPAPGSRDGGHRVAPAGLRTIADRHQGHRRHDPDRPGPARAHHR